MGDSDSNSVKISGIIEKNTKNPALGKGTPVVESNSLIPFETPGRELIRSRTPFKEIPKISFDDNIRSVEQIHNTIPLNIAKNSPDSSNGSLNRRGVSNDNIPKMNNNNFCQHFNYKDDMYNSGFNMKNQQYNHMYPPHMYPPNMYPPQNNMISQVPDYDSMSKQEQEDARIIFMSKFNTLKEKYPERSFDDYNPSLPLRHIHRIYEEHLTKISSESNFSISRIFLTIMFLCIEGFFTKFLGINIQGFAMEQINQMKKYDSLLMELGEKYSSSFGSNWPIEVRIFFFIGFNTLSVAAIKFLCDKTGYDLDSAIKTFNSVFGNSVEKFVNSNNETKVDPVTNTADPTANDSSTNFMGRAQDILNMTSSLFGGPKGSDATKTIGHWGAKALEKLNENSKSNVKKDNSIEISAKPEPKGKTIKDLKFGKGRDKK